MTAYGILDAPETRDGQWLDAQRERRENAAGIEMIAVNEAEWRLRQAVAVIAGLSNIHKVDLGLDLEITLETGLDCISKLSAEIRRQHGVE